MLYKSLHGLSPHYIREMVEFHTPERTGLRSDKIFQLLKVTSKEKLSQPGPTALWPLCGGTNFLTSKKNIFRNKEKEG